jgi:hypothetical protein
MTENIVLLHSSQLVISQLPVLGDNIKRYIFGDWYEAEVLIDALRRLFPTCSIERKNIMKDLYHNADSGEYKAVKLCDIGETVKFATIRSAVFAMKLYLSIIHQYVLINCASRSLIKSFDNSVFNLTYKTNFSNNN